jgi:hypothetical protein
MLEKVKKYRIYDYFFWSEESKLRHQKKVAETRKPCSCYACGNQRRNPYAKGGEKLTLQERRMNEYEIE